ncbi:hypothetical protein [Mesonia sp.]|nr:hypothetical protein [Mesonia sp.]MAN25939.1 hypothetical protein [Mesonia sp.]MAN26140.1 hypothetical protein [Mesonia sp.]MAQ39508.1 hypothetical protein [Mesonia sp.]
MAYTNYPINNFIKIIMIAFSIAAPISWWASQKWLEDYAYTINLNGWYFAGAGLLTLIIAVLTVSSKTIQAAVQNPVKSLRSEE